MEAVKVREELSEYLDGLQEQMPLAFWKLAEILNIKYLNFARNLKRKKRKAGKVI